MLPSAIHQARGVPHCGTTGLSQDCGQLHCQLGCHCHAGILGLWDWPTGGSLRRQACLIPSIFRAGGPLRTGFRTTVRKDHWPLRGNPRRPGWLIHSRVGGHPYGLVRLTTRNGGIRACVVGLPFAIAVCVIELTIVTRLISGCGDGWNLDRPFHALSIICPLTTLVPREAPMVVVAVVFRDGNEQAFRLLPRLGTAAPPHLDAAPALHDYLPYARQHFRVQLQSDVNRLLLLLRCGVCPSLDHISRRFPLGGASGAMMPVGLGYLWLVPLEVAAVSIVLDPPRSCHGALPRTQ
mmetsp:Transcript_3913/g.11364  ORF Transcript_3913/g.11364 Transcript_3913/m.11364 type:complete len:294 (-) Transcript_3913:2301-3182(-)